VSFYGVHPDNVRIVPFPADDCFRALDNVPVDISKKCGIRGDFIFYPAQFWPHKNHVNLLLALKLLNDDSSVPLELVLSGSDKGNLHYVQQTVDRLGLSQLVHFVGFVSREDLANLYRQAIALIYPSFFGPDNLPPLEAFAIGCPVAAARVAGADEQLGSAAILFDPARPDEIADAVRRIRNNEKVRSELIRRGRAQVQAKTPKEYVEQVCGILNEFEPIRRCWAASHVHI
jgi:glycosyltransferase involved in cell wall biosynthesis